MDNKELYNRQKKVRLDRTDKRNRLHIGSYFVDLNESDYNDLVEIFSEEKTKELQKELREARVFISNQGEKLAIAEKALEEAYEKGYRDATSEAVSEINKNYTPKQSNP